MFTVFHGQYKLFANEILLSTSVESGNNRHNAPTLTTLINDHVDSATILCFKSHRLPDQINILPKIFCSNVKETFMMGQCDSFSGYTIVILHVYRCNHLLRTCQLCPRTGDCRDTKCFALGRRSPAFLLVLNNLLFKQIP